MLRRAPGLATTSHELARHCRSSCPISFVSRAEWVGRTLNLEDTIVEGDVLGRQVYSRFDRGRVRRPCCSRERCRLALVVPVRLSARQSIEECLKRPLALDIILVHWHFVGTLEALSGRIL